MTVTEAQEFLVNLLNEQGEIKDAFKRNVYADNFEERYEEIGPDLLALEEAYVVAPDKEAFLSEIGKEPAASLKEELDAIKSKRKKDLREMNASLTMVTFVLPLLLHYNKPFTDTLTDEIVDAWGETFPKSKIKKATFEEINDGFRRKWCYITTAVCDNLGKSDDCYELTLLRQYRDGYLLKQKDGAEMIRQYYDVAPTIVKRINRKEDAKQIYCDIYEEYLKPCIRLIEEDRLSECCDRYRTMVTDLKNQYLFS